MLLNLEKILKRAYYRGSSNTKESDMYVISDDCISCGACQPECPVEAIEEGEDKYVITDKCTDCGSCAEVCPTEAISPGN